MCEIHGPQAIFGGKKEQKYIFGHLRTRFHPNVGILGNENLSSSYVIGTCLCNRFCFGIGYTSLGSNNEFFLSVTNTFILKNSYS